MHNSFCCLWDCEILLLLKYLEQFYFCLVGLKVVFSVQPGIIKIKIFKMGLIF